MQKSTDCGNSDVKLTGSLLSNQKSCSWLSNYHLEYIVDVQIVVISTFFPKTLSKTISASKLT